MDIDNIESFKTITGTDDDEVAKSFLEFSSGDLEQAITLFFESGGAGPARSTDRVEEDQDPAVREQLDQIAEADARLAQHLNDQWNAVAADQRNQAQVNALRSPIPATTTRLNEDDGFSFLEQGMSRNGFNALSPPIVDLPNVDRETPYIIPEEMRQDIRPPNQINSTPRLNGRIRRLEPIGHFLRIGANEIGRKINIDEARRLGKVEKKFVLVTITDRRKHSVLNLENIFRHTETKQLLKEKFIVLMHYSDSELGMEYANFYPIRSYPHIAVIDPRTGERLKVFLKNISPSELLRDLKQFLNKNSFTGQLEYPGFENLPPKDVDVMTEQEMMEAAIQASLGQSSSNQNHLIDGDAGSPISIDDDDEFDDDMAMEDNDSNDDIDDDNKEVQVIQPQLTPEQIVVGLQPTELPDFLSGPDTTRLQFRLPDNSRVVKVVSKLLKVEDLFRFAKTLAPMEAKELELVVVKDRLISKLDMTLAEAHAINCVITVTYHI